MQLTRRSLLASGTAATFALAGCLGLSDREQLSLELLNYTSEPQPITVSLLRPDRREFSEAEVLSREFEVPPPDADESAGASSARNVAPRRRYLVRATPKYGIRNPYRYQYFPGENATEPAEASIRVRIYPNCYFRDCDDTEGVYVRF